MTKIQTERQMIKFMRGKSPSEKIALQWLFDIAETSSGDADDAEFGVALYKMVDNISDYYEDFQQSIPEERGTGRMSLDQATAYHSFRSIVRGLLL